MAMNALVGRSIAWLGLALAALPAWGTGPDVLYYSCKMKPSGAYMIRIDTVADVMWVNGNRLKLDGTDKEYRATEFSGEPNELKAEYRINRTSGSLRRVSYGLKGALGTQEGTCKASERPVDAGVLY